MESVFSRRFVIIITIAAIFFKLISFPPTLQAACNQDDLTVALSPWEVDPYNDGPWGVWSSGYGAYTENGAFGNQLRLANYSLSDDYQITSVTLNFEASHTGNITMYIDTVDGVQTFGPSSFSGTSASFSVPHLKPVEGVDIVIKNTDSLLYVESIEICTISPTSTPTPTASPTYTVTPSATPTIDPTQIFNTPVPTFTPIPTPTPTPGGIPVPTPVPMPSAATFPTPNYDVPTSIPALSLPAIPSPISGGTPISLVAISTTFTLSYTAPITSLEDLSCDDEFNFTFDADTEDWTFVELTPPTLGFHYATDGHNAPGSLAGTALSGSAEGEWRYYLSTTATNTDTITAWAIDAGVLASNYVELFFVSNLSQVVEDFGVGFHYTDGTEDIQNNSSGGWMQVQTTATDGKQIEYVFLRSRINSTLFDDVSISIATPPNCDSTGELLDTTEGILIASTGYISDMISYTDWLSGEIATMQSTNTFTIATAPAWYAPDLPRPMADVGWTFEILQADVDAGTRYSLDTWVYLFGYMVSLPVQLAKILFQIAALLGPVGLFLSWLLVMLPAVLFIKLFVFVKNIIVSILNQLIALFKLLLDILNTLANWIDVLTGPFT